MVAVGAHAQYAQHQNLSAPYQQKQKAAVSSADRNAFVPATHHVAAKTTATTAAAFMTETFGSGAATGMPAGWSAGSTAGNGGTWHWAIAAAGGTYSIGPLAAPASISDGWMVYNSDSIGDPSYKPSGFLTSPAYDCSAHSTVRLSFYESFREFEDSCVVWVSTSPTFSTYTSFPVLPNNTMADNTSTANPQMVHMNISSVAAGHSAVYLRFVYYCNYAGGTFNWLIDDVSLSELDPDDVGIEKSFMYEYEPTLDYNGSIFNTPLEFVDSVAPVTRLSNYGANTETVTATAQIFRGATSVYSQSATYTGLPVSAADSIVQWKNYLPNAIGNYTCAINASIAATDADLTNNADTIRFAVTDTTWMENMGTPNGSYSLHRAAAGSSSAVSYYFGTRFDVPPTSAGDTVSGFGVGFAASSVATNAGATVSVQLYSHAAGASGWNYIGTSKARAVTASDISTSASDVVWAYFAADPIATSGYLLMSPGMNYAAIVATNGVTGNLSIYSTPPPNATGFSGYFGQADTSLNDGTTNFAPTSNATGLQAVPMVRLYFNKIKPVGVDNVTAENVIGNAYPNPANSEVTVPFTLAKNADVHVALTNIMGQEIKSQTVNAAAGQPNKVTFATSGLAAGVYLYTVAVDGQHTTGRITVTH